MQNTQLYINGQLVDLSTDNPIALTFQINNLADVRNQSGNTSNQFKIPLTQRNRRILGFPDDIKITTNIPYQTLEAKIVQDGIEIVPAGIGEINSADENTASITVLSGNVDFFDTIDAPLYDMGDSTKPTGAKKSFLPYQHVWNLNTVVASRLNTEGYIYPVIDYGLLNQDQPYNIDIRYMRPGFFIKTAIDLIVKNAGYKAKGSLLSDPLYPKLIAQFSNSSYEHGSDYQSEPDNKGINVTQPLDFTIAHFAGQIPAAPFRFNQINSDPSNQFIGNIYYTANSVNTLIVTATFPHVYLRGYVTPTQNSSKLIAYIMYHRHGTPNSEDISLASFTFGFDGHGENNPGQSDSDPNGWRRITGSGGSIIAEIDLYKTKLSCEAELGINDSIWIEYGWAGRDPKFATFFKGAILDVKSQKANVRLGQQIQCERIFPDISQKDLLKDTLQRFGIICQTDNTKREITFLTFKDIVKNIPIAKNWTSKVLNQGKGVAFDLGNYSQVNKMLYKADEAITPGYADDVININDKTLSAQPQTMIESVFAPSLNTPYIGGVTAQVKMIDPEAEDNEFSIAVSPRILVDQKINLFQLGNVTVNFTDGVTSVPVNDTISTPYFYKANGAFNLCWKDQDGQSGLRAIYYKELERILTKTKKLTRYVMLTPRDIAELDLGIPIYIEQDNAYFYINVIAQWVKGTPTKVELVKLGEINN